MKSRERETMRDKDRTREIDGQLANAESETEADTARHTAFRKVQWANNETRNKQNKH